MAWSNKIVRVTRIIDGQQPYTYISDRDGKNFRMPEYWNRGNWHTDAEVLDNFVYSGRLHFVRAGYSRGGLTHGYFLMDDRCMVQMVSTEFASEIPKMDRGLIFGRFTWKKIGSAVNLYRVPDTLEQ